ncbi:tandem-95 repeat protein [Novipirellula caenicola]|uniref:tandem-95 repeat protein n=1 Tax=Novipirellula caenicola TaxID=1536901 RepID=UPI0031E8E1A1
MLAGPQLIGIQPNDGDLIVDGSVRDSAPSVLTFRFDQDQQIDANTLDGIRITRPGEDGIFQTADDLQITPGLVTLGDPNENEVVVRFAESLPDDDYRVEVFGYDDPGLGISGLRNIENEFLVPRTAGQRSEVINFSLRLGALIEAVVPQPVVRLADGSLQQNRNEIVVYFNEDPLFVENDDNGNPTERSAENPRFYQLLLTDETARTTDDLLFHPDSVEYDATTHTARLFFSGDINDLPGVPLGGGTFRLRIGSAVDNRVDLIIQPTDVAVAPVAVRDFGVQGLRVSFVSKSIGEAASGRNVRFEDVGAAGLSVRAETDGTVVFNFGGDSPTLTDLRTVVLSEPTVNSLIEVKWTLNGNANQGGSTLVPRSLIGAPALVLSAVGDTLGTSLDIGVFGRDEQLTSLIFEESIDAQPFLIELPGGNDDPGHRELDEVAGALLQHINDNFGPDTQNGITEIAYNFSPIFDTSPTGVPFQNQITERQKTRIREALGLWASEIGVQFRETADSGITFALGDVSNLQAGALPDTSVVSQSVLNARVRIDPTFTESALVFSNQVTFNTAYGEDFLRKATAGIGLILGLEQTPDLPSQTLMSLNSTYLNNSINSRPDEEPVFPGNFDVLHGQYVHRPDSIDVDLYRFQVDLDDVDRLGQLTVETFAERLPDSSLLDTTLTLYQEVKASAMTDFGVGGDLQVRFDSLLEGRLGNNLRIDFIQTDRAAGDTVVRVTQPTDSTGQPIANAILVDLPRRGANVSSVPVQSIVDAVNASPFASSIVRATRVAGAATTDVSGSALNFSPILLSGGGIVQLGRNDDYFSEDSRLTASLGEGTYYVGVAASGNDNYDPTIAGSGYGGLTQGKYELHVKFEPQVDETDVIRDLDSDRVGVPGTILDGDGDGQPGGAHNFWFQTRPLNRTLTFTDNGDAITIGQTIKVTGAAGVVRTFEFVPIGSTAKPGNVAVLYSPGSPNFPTPSGTLATTLQTAINSRQNETGVTATISGNSVILMGEREIELSTNTRALEASGRNIFVDKTAGPNADGSLDHPFNNISNSNVANAFDAALPNDIVRIVGNGGVDKNMATEADNFSYKIGIPDVGGGFLEDGRVMEVPKEVTTMIDAGAVFKVRGSWIGVGSSTVQVDRSNGVLQVLGTPRLVDLSDPSTTTLLGNDDADRPGYDDGSVIFTSFRDRNVDASAVGNSPAVSPGNWGGLIFRRDIDQAEGRQNLEDQGIFLNQVNHAEIRYGGSSNVLIDSVQQLVNPIQIVNLRPTISFSEITSSADAAISASPDSFEETSYQSPRFQQAGAYTADYDRVGPDIHNNQLFENSINGLFVRVGTTSIDPPRALTVAGRFDDTSVVHFVAENIVVAANPGGSIEDGFAPSTSLISAQALRGGTFTPGTYLYKMTFVDSDGFESLASTDQFSFTVSSSNTSIELTGLPQVQTGSGYVSRRLYRAVNVGGTPVYKLVADLDASSISYIDNGSSTDGVLDLSLQGIRGRLDASLVIDPGTVVKIRGARFELGYGTQLLAEGTESNPVVFTSVFDDRFGAGGTFDTNNDGQGNGGGTSPNYGDWSGIYAGPTSNVSFDHATVAYAGGISLLEGGQARGFNALELQQADGRITNSRFEFNEDGQDGAGPAGRFGRLINTPSTIFVRGSQPIIVGTTFTDNRGSIIDIDSESMTGERLIDAGRQTGNSDRLSELDDNYGPMIRFNRYEDTVTEGNSTLRQLSGLEIRGGTLTTESVWDDTDIVHMLFDGLTVENFHSSGGLRLLSRVDESLVVKLTGAGTANSATLGTGITATGSIGDIQDRIGGAIHIIGQPGRPVVLTSLQDDTVGAGLKPDGSQFTDTNGDGIQSRPESNDWRSVFLDQYSNDRNVDVITEFELPTEVAPGLNGAIENAQLLGELAPNLFSGDENLRHGFEVEGYLSSETDVDTYTFTGTPGTEIWVDIDRTTYTLDSVIELLDENGQVLARSDNSFEETSGDASVVVLDPSLLSSTTSLQAAAEEYTERGAGGLYEDFGSTNPRDAGIHFTLPGNSANPSARSVFFFRVRSASVNPDDLQGGLTYGGYRFQVRLTEEQEFPGSVIRYTDIRYANHGIHTRGLPSSSPLVGEAGENEGLGFFNASNDRIDTSPGLFSDNTPLGQRPQNIGNLVGNKNGVISVAGSLSSTFDVDFYQFDVDYSVGDGSLLRSTVFDIDYADGFNRPNTTVSVFYDPDGEQGIQLPRLVLFGEDANILDDLTSPNGENSSLEKLLRGSIGNGDAFIGPVSLPEGTYYVAVTADGTVPFELTNNDLVRREPINSVHRIVEDRINPATPSTATQADLIKLFSDATIAAGGFVEEIETNPGHGKPTHFDGSNGVTSTGAPRIPEFTVAGGDAPNNVGGGNAANLDALDFSLIDDSEIGGRFIGSQFSGGVSENTSVYIPHVSIAGNLQSDLADFYQFTLNDDGHRVIIDLDNGYNPFQGVNDTDPLTPTYNFDPTSVDTDFVLLRLDPANPGQLQFVPGTGRITTSSADDGRLGSAPGDNGGASLDPFIDMTLNAGTYFIGVLPSNTTFAFNQNGGTTLTNDAISNNAQTYTLHVSIEDHVLPLGTGVNTALHYDRLTNSTPGTITSEPFSLAGYVAADLPTFYYNYKFDPSSGDSVSLRIFSAENPVGVTTNATPNSDAEWYQNRLSLEQFAGHTDIQFEFTYTPNGGGTVIGTGEGLFLDDFIVGFAERGETIFNARSGEDRFTGFGSGESGEYQLEMRPGTQYATPTAAGTVLNLDFDTNDRHSETITIVAPAGDQIVDGDTFIISDGSVSQTFEFTTTAGTVRFGNTPVLFSASDDPSDVAQSIRTAIRTQTRISVEASSAAGQDTNGMTDGRLALVGARGGSFVGVANVNQVPPAGTRLDLDANGNLELPVIFNQGLGDFNYERRQSQLVIQNNKISDVHAIGIWSEPGLRDTDPEDVRQDPRFGNFNPFNPSTITQPHPFMQQPPVGNPQPGVARNLPTLNDEVIGGLMPGVVVRNNTIDQAGYTGIKVEGETRPWMIEIGDGDDVADGVTMAIDSGGTRVVFEFEDIGGTPTTASGSGVQGGDGVADGHVPIYYRRTHASNLTYNGRAGANAYTSIEMAMAIMQSIQGSILVTNDAAELVTPYVGPSLLTDDEFANANARVPMDFTTAAVYLTGVSNIYISTRVAETPRVANITTTLAPVAEPLQPFSRIVNNTIYGADGTEGLFPESADREGDDTIATAIDTKIGRSHVGAYVDTGTIGDNSGPIGAAGDVDFYRVEMEVGDRLIVDIDTSNALDTVLQIFDAGGVAQTLANGLTVMDNATAPSYLNPGSTVANPTNDVVNNRDPFVDFTALSTGTYYIAVSSKGNESFDPADLSGRQLGTGGTGDYTISIENYTARGFVMSINNGAINDGGGVRGADLVGTTFTVTQIPDVPNAATNQVTFTFSNTGGVGNVVVADGDHMPDIITAIRTAINNHPLLVNHTQGNGPGGISGPIQHASALALGGSDGDNGGIENLTLRYPGPLLLDTLGSSSGLAPVLNEKGSSLWNSNDLDELPERNQLPGNRMLHALAGNTTDFQSGYGHNRLSTPGNGTTELYVAINNVAKIELSAEAQNAGLTLDPVAGRDTDQVLNETGVMIAGGSSPAILNNVFVNLHESVVIEETNALGFGQNINSHPKPMTQDTVVVGSVFQFDQPNQTAFNSQMSFIANSTGITTGNNEPSNLNGGTDDFNVTLGNFDPSLEYAAGNNFLPIGDSLLVDSSVNSLTDRDTFKALKASVGIPESNVLAPIRDVNGILRADNPFFQPPGTVGESIFRDRGSNELADFVGPVAIAEIPRDNDAEGIDSDPAVSFINLTGGTYKEFRIQLRDNGDASDPFPGIGIDDNTVVVPEIEGLRPSGANVTLFEDDRLLEEGIDYIFSYDVTKNLITLTPLAGIWQDDRSYRIALNNRDRTVLSAPEGRSLADGDQITITDANGGDIVFEFETGYQLQLPETISLIVPQVGTNFGGLSDGDIFQIDDGVNPVVVFELDSDGAQLPSSVVVPLPSERPPTDPAALRTFLNGIALNIQAAIDAEVAAGRLNVETKVDSLSDPNGDPFRVVIGAEPGTTATTSGSGLLQDARTLALRVPEVGSAFGGVVDGDTFVVNDGTQAITFEFEISGGLVDPANTAVAIASDLTANQVAVAIQQAILASSLRLNARVDADSVYLNLPVDGSANVPFGQLTLVGLSRTPTDGDLITFSPNNGADPISIEINRTDEPSAVLGTTIDDGVTVPNIPVNITRLTTASELAEKIVAAIQSTKVNGVDRIVGLDTDQVTVIDGSQVSIGGEQGLGVGVTGTSLEVVGSPDVTGASTIEVFGPLLLNLPLVGGGGFQDGSVLILRDNLGNDVVFEFNLINTQQSVANAIPVTFNTFDTVDILADTLVTAINGSTAGITAQNLLNGRISLGRIAADRVDLDGIPADPTIPGSGSPGVSQIAIRRGIVSDGEVLTLRQGTVSVSFEFESVNNGGGVVPGNVAIPFQPTSTIGDIAVSLAAAINNNRGSLRVSATADLDLQGEPTGTVSLDDLPGTVVDASQAPTLNVIGVPGGAIAIPIEPNFTAEQIKTALLQSINGVNQPGQPALTNLVAEDRGGGTFFVENGQIFQGPISTFFLPGIKDQVGNPLEPNRDDQSTQFTILMPTVGLDFGDAPDPVSGIAGRYPTTLANDGPRHVVGDEIMLGTKVDVDVNGMPGAAARGDNDTISASTTGSLFAVNIVDGRVEVTVNASVDASTRDGDTITIDTGVDIVTLEFDINGRFNEDHFAIRATTNTPEAIAAAIVAAIEESPLRPAAVSSEGAVVTVDGNDEDGVDFVSDLNPNGILNRSVGVTRVDANGDLILDDNGNVAIFMPIKVTGTGVLDAWIDFAADGDFTDVGDQIITGAILNGEEQTFYVPFPSNAPNPVTATDTYARFRVSRNGGLQPTGLALSGEVEDYRLRLLPGSAPAVGNQQANRTYTVEENRPLQVLDSTGSLTPSNSGDDGILVGVVDADNDDVAIYAPDVRQETLFVSGVEAGELDLRSDGTFTFVPAQDFNGQVTFSARVTDVKPLNPASELLSARPILVTINVTPVNNPPVLIAPNPGTSVRIDEDTVTTFTKAQLIDPFYSPGPANEANQPLIFQSVGSVRGPFLSSLGGIIAISSDQQSLIYTPPVDYNGSQADTFTYVVADVPGTGQTPENAAVPGVVTINFNSVNDAPRLVNDTYTAQEDQALIIPLRTTDNRGILDNDAAGPADEVNPPQSQTISLVTSNFPQRTFRGGNVVLENGNLRYTPPSQFSGVDQFNYSVVDSEGASSSALVIINVGGQNDAPQFIGINGNANETSLTFDESKDDARTVQFDLSTWFSDPENDEISYTVTSSNSSIVAARVLADTLILDLPPYAFGNATLSITAVDTSGATVVTQIPVTVNDTPDPPTLVGTFNPLSGVEDQLVTANLSTVFADPDGEPLNYSVARIGNITNPTTAQIAQHPLVQSVSFVNGEMQIQLKPNQSGSVELEVAATDGSFRISDAFTLTVTATPDAPVARNDGYNVPVGTQLQVLNPAEGLLGNDVDADGDTLSIDLNSVTPTSADFNLNADGTFTFKASTGNVGDTITFSYNVVDSTGLVSNTATVTFTLNKSRYQNPIASLVTDVNADGAISALDALRIINLLNQRLTGSASSLPVEAIGTPPPDYVDVSGDGFVSAFDALLVINALELRGGQPIGQGEAVAEGEFAVQTDAVTTDANLAASVSYASPSAANLPVRNAVAVAAEGESATSMVDPRDAILQAGFEIGRSVVENVVDQFGDVDSDAATSDSSSVDLAIASLLEDSFIDGDLR